MSEEMLRATWRVQRERVDGILDGIVGGNADDRAKMRGDLVKLATRWINCDNDRLALRGGTVALKLEHLFLHVVEAGTRNVIAQTKLVAELNQIRARHDSEQGHLSHVRLVEESNALREANKA